MAQNQKPGGKLEKTGKKTKQPMDQKGNETGNQKPP